MLLSNEVKDPIEALEIYRNKDLVEFVALIYLSYIKKKMQDKNLFKKYTMQELFDEFDIIKCFEQPGCELCVGEVTKLQIQLYEAMEIAPPTSLH